MKKIKDIFLDSHDQHLLTSFCKDSYFVKKGHVELLWHGNANKAAFESYKRMNVVMLMRLDNSDDIINAYGPFIILGVIIFWSNKFQPDMSSMMRKYHSLTSNRMVSRQLWVCKIVERMTTFVAVLKERWISCTRHHMCLCKQWQEIMISSGWGWAICWCWSCTEMFKIKSHINW